MSFNLIEFPKQLPVSMKDKRGRRLKTKLTRDKTRLVVAFRRARTREAVEALLGKVGLRLEDAGEHEIRAEITGMVEDSLDVLKKHPDKKKQFSDEVQARAKKRATEFKCSVPNLSRRVTHTASRFWVRSESPVDQKTVDNLIREAENATMGVRWIGPVYQFPGAVERQGVFCPLPNVLIVQPAATVDDRELTRKLDKLGLREIKGRSKYMRGNRYFMLKNDEFEAKTTTYKLARDLGKCTKLIQNVSFENVPLLSAASAIPSVQPYSPNDPFYQSNDQWNLRAIGAEEGWGFLNQLQQNGTRLHPVTICILDSDGVERNHEEFQGRVVRPYTVPGADTDPTNPLPPGQADPTDGHGTCCAGITVAATDNSLGIAGIAGLGLFTLMPVRVGEALSAWAAGIIYAADAGADVISISMNPTDVTAEEMDDVDAAIAYAANKKAVVVCVSSGNDNHQDSVQYPATHPDVIACGAITADPRRCQPGDWSYLGPNAGSSYGVGLSVVAPGISIATTTVMTRGNRAKGYSFGFEGTSAATPHVAGLAALILSVNPDLRASSVKEIIETSASELRQYPRNRDGKNAETGYGLINVMRALQLVPRP